MSAFDSTFLNYTTREHFIPVLRNQVYSKRVLFAMLRAGGRLKPATGRSLLWDHVARKHTGVGVYSGYDVLPAQPGNPLEQGSLSPAQYFAPLVISGHEIRSNTGSKEKLVDQLTVQEDNARITLEDLMATHTYASSATIGGKNVINGLGLVCSTTNTYAGINRSTAGNEYWQSNSASASAYSYTDLIDPTSVGYLPKLMRRSQSSATYDAAPGLIITTSLVFDMYQDIYGIQNFRGDGAVANLGFPSVKFGNTEMTWDRYQTAGYMNFLDLGSFQFFYYPGANFDLKEPGWAWAQNQDAMLAYIIWEGQLRCDTPRQQALLSGISTS